jgi:hypothetical protein
MTAYFPVLLLPVCVNGRCHFDQPRAVFGSFQKVCRGRILGAVRRGVAKWLEQAAMDQRGNILRLAIEDPSRLLRIQSNGQLTEQGQKSYQAQS